MVRWARERRVFVVEEPLPGEGAPRLDHHRDASGVSVLTPRLPKNAPEDAVAKLIERAVLEHEIGPFVAWYYTPMMLDLTRGLNPAAVVYDCMDELANFQGASPKLKSLEKELCRQAVVMFTGGHHLYEAKRAAHSNVHPFPSSVDVPHFRAARELTAEPADQAGIPHPRMGFYGVIDERLDVDLLRGVAEAKPEWHIVLLGPVAKIDDAALPRAANIHFLGMKKYDELPSYLAGWDVAILPFALNDATRFISPTKTPEYLAGGKPVVSTSIRDVVRPYGESGLAHIADGAEAFAAAVEAAVSEDAASRLENADRFLADLSWDRTWSRMKALIERELAGDRDGHPNENVHSGTNGSGNTHANGNGNAHANGNGHANGNANVNGNGRANGKSPAQTRRAAFDYLVVGAGFSGSVTAERLAANGKKVLLCDKRPHIGGNAYDHFDKAGILVHKYGPHIFHTNSKAVFEYLSRFTGWRDYRHRVLTSVDGKLLPIPINLTTINKLYGWDLDSAALEKFFDRVREPRDPVRNSEDTIVNRVGRELYEKFFRGYTRKQWGLDPSELDACVAGRIPTRTDADDRYFTDEYQAMPRDGFTAMFGRMLDHRNITLELGTDYKALEKKVDWKEMVYTGPVDAFFGHRFGRLPYRSLEFKFETHDVERFQQGAVINHPNEHLYTRVSEFKYLTGQTHSKTSVVYEFPKAEGDPYYPIPKKECAELYRRYEALAQATPNVHFSGRLATYRYYNMDQVVAQALTLCAKLTGKRELLTV